MFFNICAVEFSIKLFFFLFQIKLRGFYKSCTCTKISVSIAIWWSMILNDEDVNDVNDDEELLASDKWWSIFCDKQLLWEAGMYSLSGKIMARVCSFVTHCSLQYIASKQSKKSVIHLFPCLRPCSTSDEMFDVVQFVTNRLLAKCSTSE